MWKENRTYEYCRIKQNTASIMNIFFSGWERSSNETIWDAENNFGCCGLEGRHDGAYRCDDVS